jgi:uncharacterized protein YndB with AHSA1/START domain
MTVSKVQKDVETLTMTITAEFEAPIERIWRLWKDPRQLERWWGPPTYPATVTEHELVPGGSVAYHMTGPEGDKHHGWWRIEEVDEPRRLRFRDGFADADGNADDAMPTTIATVSLSETGGRTTMTIESRFASREAMDQLTAMGMEEGMAAALGQIDELLEAEKARS